MRCAYNGIGCVHQRLIVLTNLLQHPQHLADLEDLVHLAGAGEQGPEGIELSHDAAHGPQVDGGAVGGGPQQDLRGAVPAQQTQGHKSESQGQMYLYSTVSYTEVIQSALK